MTRQIFRRVNPDTNVQDIYAIEGDSARYLNPTEFTQNYASPTNAQGVTNEAVEDLGVNNDLYNQYFPQQDNLTGGDENIESQIPNPTAEESVLSSATKAKTERDKGLAELEEMYASQTDPNGEDVFEQQKTDLDNWLKEQQDAINKQFDDKITKRKGEQANIKGSTNLFFAGAGATNTASGRGALVKQATVHRDEINALEAEKQRLLSQAMNAYRTGKTNIAIASRDRADKLEAQQVANYEKLFELKMNMAEMDRADIEWEQEQEAYQREEAIKKFDLIAMSGKDLNTEQTQTLAQSMGMTIPQFNAYYDNYKAGVEASAQKEALELKKLMKEANTVNWKTEKIDEGSYTKTYVYDPTDREGTYKLIATAPRWKATGGGGGSDYGGMSDSDIETVDGDFMRVIGNDGFASPTDYAKIKSNWIAGGGSADDFDKEFEYRRNPQNTNYDVVNREERDYSEELAEIKGKEGLENRVKRDEWEQKIADNPDKYYKVDLSNGFQIKEQLKRKRKDDDPVVYTFKE